MHTHLGRPLSLLHYPTKGHHGVTDGSISEVTIVGSFPCSNDSVATGWYELQYTHVTIVVLLQEFYSRHCLQSQIDLIEKEFVEKSIFELSMETWRCWNYGHCYRGSCQECLKVQR